MFFHHICNSDGDGPVLSAHTAQIKYRLFFFGRSVKFVVKDASDRRLLLCEQAPCVNGDFYLNVTVMTCRSLESLDAVEWIKTMARVVMATGVRRTCEQR